MPGSRTVGTHTLERGSPSRIWTGPGKANRAFLAVLVIWTLLSAVPVHGSEGPDPVPAQQDEWVQPPQPLERSGHFTENLGQWGPHVRFLAQSSFGHAVFGEDGITYDVATEEGGHRVKVAFGAEGPVEPMGIGDMGFESNFFLGNDPEGWVTGARSFRELVYRDVWPGIDMRYRYSGGDLKYDLLLDAGADPSSIRFKVEGSEGLDASGDRLSIGLSGSRTIQDRDLVAWYEDGEPVDIGFRLDGDGFGFDVAKEEGRAMVIDPVVVHASTYLGGTYSEDAADIQVDREGNIVVFGMGGSIDYPVTPGAYDEEPSDFDVLITKMNHNCSRIIWSTFLGGNNYDFSSAIDLDGADFIYVSGWTYSQDFPVTSGAYQGEANLGTGWSQVDIFITKLSPDGDAVLCSTFVGGTGPDTVGDIEVWNGKVGLAGWTDSGDFPTTKGSHAANFGAAILLVLDANLTRLENCWVWDGIGGEMATTLEFDKNGDIVVAAYTSSPGLMTTPEAYQRSKPGGCSGFVARYSVTDDMLLFSTYLGGIWDMIYAVEVDDDLNVYVGGFSRGGGGGFGYPTTEGAYDREYNGNTEGFVTKMDPEGSRLIYSTLLGGDGDDVVNDIELDDDGNLIVVGTIGSGANFTITPGCHDVTWSGETEGFVRIFNTDGTALRYSSFHGAMYGDTVVAVEFDDADNLVITGSVLSSDFNVTEDAFQTRYAGGQDKFVSVVGELAPTSEPLSLSATGHEGYIELTWLPPERIGPYPIREYQVFRGTSEADLRPYQVLDNVINFVDREVEWGVEYYYAVRADNRKGLSPLSNVASARSVTVPDPPVNLTASAGLDCVSLDWEPPRFMGGLPLTIYNVYRTAEGGARELVGSVGPDVLTFEDREAEDGTWYTYSVTVANEYGESRREANATLLTTAVPSPPMNVDHTYGDLFIRLRWEPPEADFGLPVMGYRVFRQTGDGPFELVGSVPAPTRSFVDTQVGIGVGYRYRVTAENAKGESDPSEPIDAMVMVRPDPPKSVEAVAHGHFVKVTWSPPEFDGASPVLSYRIYLLRAEGAICLGGPMVGGAADGWLAFLHDAPYDGVVRTYFVTAINLEGESDPSERASTLAYEPPEAPGSLTVQWGDGQVGLEWHQPAYDGGTPVLSYTVYRRAEGEGTFTKLATSPKGTLSYTDDTAENGVEYTYRMTCTNMIGESAPSLEATAVPAGPPDAPLGVSAEGLDGSARVTWQPPAWDGGRDVAGYRVYAVADGMEKLELAELGPDGRELVQDGLVNGGVYRYAVRAFTEAGVSGLSVVVEARPVGPPASPHSLLAIWMGDHVRLTWDRPLDDGGAPILGYRLHREDREAGNWTEVADPMFLDFEVRPGETYNYTICAYTDAGAGPVATVTVTVPPEPPTAPEPQVMGWSYMALLVVLVALAIAIALVGRNRRRGEPGTGRP